MFLSNDRFKVGPWFGKRLRDGVRKNRNSSLDQMDGFKRSFHLH